MARFHFSGAEAMFAAEQQLEAAQGVNETPFVTMKLTINEKHEIIVEAFQVRFVCFWRLSCLSLEQLLITTPGWSRPDDAP